VSRDQPVEEPPPDTERAATDTAPPLVIDQSHDSAVDGDTVQQARDELDALRVAHGMQPLHGTWAEVSGSPDSAPAS